MPTPDDNAPPRPRAQRRRLGRGPSDAAVAQEEPTPSEPSTDQRLEAAPAPSEPSHDLAPSAAPPAPGPTEPAGRTGQGRERAHEPERGAWDAESESDPGSPSGSGPRPGAGSRSGAEPEPPSGPFPETEPADGDEPWNVEQPGTSDEPATPADQTAPDRESAPGEEAAPAEEAGPVEGPEAAPEAPKAPAERADPADPAGSEAAGEREGPGEREEPEGEEPADTGEPGEAGNTGETGDPGETGETEETGEQDDGRFRVVLDNFEGPFDLLLQLISKHKLDVTEVALSRVTDEFMAYIHALGPDWDLDQTTEFLVVAATLLDLKAARLLPTAEVEDEADLALLEARDLLFARLLQYRAYKEIAGIFAQRLEDEARRYPRTVGLEPHHAELLPEVALSIGPEGFAKLAVKAMRPKPKPQVYVEHIHAPLVSVREQAEVVVAMLREAGETSFRTLTADAPDTLTVVARFLALLELYRECAIELEQDEALGALTVRWSGTAEAEPLVTDEFDRVPEPEEEKRT